MDEQFVLSKLDGVQPDTSSEPKVVEMKPKKPRYALISGLAAAFVAVVTLSVFGAIYFANHHDGKPSVRGTTVAPTIKSDIPLKTFGSYDEVKAQVDEVNKRSGYSSGYLLTDGYEKMEMAAGSNDSDAAREGSFSGGSSGSSSGSSDSSSGSGSSAGSDSFSETYKQVEGVDEADIVKTDGRYLYIVSHSDISSVLIYSATDAPELAATIYPRNFDNPGATPDEETLYDDDYSIFVQEMYLYDGKLIVTCLTRDDTFTYSTAAFVYDVSDINDIKLVDRFNQSGYYSSSRMIGDTLYMVSEYYIYNAEEFRIPVCYNGTEKREIPIDCVCSVKDPTENNMLIVGGFSLSEDAQEVQTSAILGTVEDVYCSESNMYIYSTKWTGYYAAVDYEIADSDSNDSDIASPKPSYEPIKTVIYKVSLSDGISFSAYGEVEGWLDSRYSLDERSGYLRVAATTSDLFDQQSNVLYILDSDLNQVGITTGFANNESIKAVRYVGDTAYVITYEQTDPLFVIDVSDPAAPAILGEVKIDGFSSMLVPVDENTVLGLGYYTEDRAGISMQVQSGFKLALFDVSDKLNPKVLDEKVYRNYYSPVMTEPRALVYNPDRGDYLIPLNYEDYHIGSDIEYYMPDIRGGALNFRVENGKLVEIDQPVVNTDNSEAETIDRCLYVGDNIYLISVEGYYSYEKTTVYTAKYQ